MYDRFIVSIVIPAHNSQAYLEYAVGSALAQVDGDFEIIIVDDGSTDATIDIAAAFEREHPEIRVVQNATPVGPGESRNRGIEIARGDWIALLDSDDQWRADRLRNLRPFLADADVVSDDVLIDSGTGKSVPLLSSNGLAISAPISLSAIDLARYQLGLLKPLIRRSFLVEHGIRYDRSLHIGEDFCLFIELLLAGARWRQIPEAYYVYRRRKGSLTNDRRQHIEGRLRSDTALLTRSQVRRDPELVRVFEKRIRRLREFHALLGVLELAAERDWRGLGRWTRANPRQAPLVVSTAARHAYHWARRRLRTSRAARGRDPESA